MSKEIEDGFRRVRALLTSMNSLLVCCQELEENSAQVGSCVFLAAELGDSISALEDRVRGWSASQPAAND